MNRLPTILTITANSIAFFRKLSSTLTFLGTQNKERTLLSQIIIKNEKAKMKNKK